MNKQRRKAQHEQAGPPLSLFPERTLVHINGQQNSPHSARATPEADSPPHSASGGGCQAPWARWSAAATMLGVPKYILKDLVDSKGMKGPLHKGFSELMEKPAPEGPNPFFKDVPSFPLRMQQDPKRMAIWFKWLINEIRAGMIRQSARENKGIAKFVMEMPIEDPVTKEHIGYRHKILVTPTSGYFKVVLFSNQELVEELGDDAKPIEFLFNFKNIYLAGFFYRNVLYVYSDASLEGLKITPSNKHFIVKMGFDGGYFDNCLQTVCLGFDGLSKTYVTLLNAIQRSQEEIRIALFRIFVSVSEPERFPYWMGRLFRIYLNGLSVSVDKPGDEAEPKTVYSKYFNQWGNISTAIVKGKKVYQSRKHPIPDMTEFETVLRYASVLLCPAKR